MANCTWCGRTLPESGGYMGRVGLNRVCSVKCKKEYKESLRGSEQVDGKESGAGGFSPKESRGETGSIWDDLRDLTFEDIIGAFKAFLGGVLVIFIILLAAFWLLEAIGWVHMNREYNDNFILDFFGRLFHWDWSGYENDYRVKDY